MSAEIIEAFVPLNPERVLKASIDANLSEVIVIGLTQDGTVRLAASIENAAQINWLCDCAKHLTMEACFVEDEE